MFKRKPKRDFWKRVDKCDHEAGKDYYVAVSCGHEHLGCAGGREWHCKKCGVFITEDPCGYAASMSGWPHRRWKGWQRMWSRKVRWTG